MDETLMKEMDPGGVIETLLQEKKALEGKALGLQTDLSALATQKNEGNLAQYQIETTELLEKLEHFYRGEYEGTDGDGNLVWKKPTDPDQIPFNEFGVSSMMEVVSKYIDKNTSLSYYSEIRIYEILADLGDELILFIQSNYEKLGMDNNFKKTKFRLVVVSTIHIIESTYRKSIGGKTMEEINQSRIITQSDLLGRTPMPQHPLQRKKGGFLNRIFGG